MSMLSRLLSRPATAVRIEPMRRRHVPAVLSIEVLSYPRPWTETVFNNELEMARRGERNYLVARHGSRVVGYAGLMFALDEAHITNIAVAPDMKRSGVATRLLAEQAWAAVAYGSTALTLEVRVSNTPAQALYERFGFESAGVRPRYYENVEDALVMWCHHIRTPEYRQRLRELCPEAAR